MLGVRRSNGDCGRRTEWRVHDSVGNWGGGKEDVDRTVAGGGDKFRVGRDSGTTGRRRSKTMVNSGMAGE